MKLLDEFWSCSPEDYDNQYATNSKSVRQAGEVVVLLAELLPKVRQRSCAACSAARARLLRLRATQRFKTAPAAMLRSAVRRCSCGVHRYAML